MVGDSANAEHRSGAGPAAIVPYLGHHLGHELHLDELCDRVDRDHAAPNAILGPPGIGKSTLATALLRREEIIRRYEHRRYFVRLDGASTAEAARELLAHALGIEGVATQRAIQTQLGGHPALLVLDNLETPWGRDKGATEDLLKQVDAVPGVALVVTLRGNDKPGQLAWAPKIEIGPLNDESARELFRKIAEPAAEDLSLIDALIAPLDGVPLLIELLANQAEARPLADLQKEWEVKRHELLEQSGGEPDKLSSWDVSVALSWESALMTDGARRLGALMAQLPDGLAFGHTDALLPGQGGSVAGALAKRALVYRDDGRWRMLMPIREHIQAKYRPSDDDLARTAEHYRTLAREDGSRPGHPGGAAALARLSPEVANLDAMIRYGLDTAADSDKEPWIDAAIDLSHFASFSGHGSPSPLEVAEAAARALGDKRREAECVRGRGNMEFYRSQHDEAQALYEQARALYEEAENRNGQADCSWRLGNIALRRKQTDAATALYEGAEKLYRQSGNGRGQADCVRQRASIALRHTQHLEDAWRLYKQARDLYEESGEIDGQGLADCLRGLGNVARERGDHEHAKGFYERALPIYQDVGSLLGEAHCVRRLGDVAREQSKRDEARGHYVAALELYRRLGDPYTMARCEQGLARLAKVDSDPRYRKHVAAARRHFQRINRPEKVAEIDKEFGQSPS